jgi:hypothetical protein
MKLSDQLRALAPTLPEHGPLLTACADMLDQSRHWKLAWAEAELKCEQLTRELNALQSPPH